MRTRHSDGWAWQQVDQRLQPPVRGDCEPRRAGWKGRGHERSRHICHRRPRRLGRVRHICCNVIDSIEGARSLSGLERKQGVRAAMTSAFSSTPRLVLYRAYSGDGPHRPRCATAAHDTPDKEDGSETPGGACFRRVRARRAPRPSPPKRGDNPRNGREISGSPAVGNGRGRTG